MTVKIDYLANHPHLIAQVAGCCCSEWPWYYDNGNLETALAYHSKTAQSCGIPCALVALEQGQFAGTITILEEDMDIRSHLSPWLGCLFVPPEFRGKGIAGLLTEAGLKLAAHQKIARIYAWTEKLGSAAMARGWTFLERVSYQGREVEILFFETGGGV